MMPSAMFYNSTLLPEAVNTSSLKTWTALPNHDIPVLFHPSSDDEVWIPDTAGWYNPSEISVTTKLIDYLLREFNANGKQLIQPDIAVIAPFREHVVRTRNALRKLSFGGVTVGTVENYQGDEMRVTVLNVVRSRERFLEWDHQKGRGVIGERRRFNVAVTRAKELLIIVGNPRILQVPPLRRLIQTDPYWRGYLSFIKRNGLATKAFPFDDSRAEKWMSSLERGMKIREEVMRAGDKKGLGGGQGGWDTDVYGEEGMWSIGAALEELILEEDWDEEEGDDVNGHS
jgi:hypothetical protein